jgi:hypothetical protein
MLFFLCNKICHLNLSQHFIIICHSIQSSLLINHYRWAWSGSTRRFVDPLHENNPIGLHFWSRKYLRIRGSEPRGRPVRSGAVNERRCRRLRLLSPPPPPSPIATIADSMDCLDQSLCVPSAAIDAGSPVFLLPPSSARPPAGVRPKIHVRLPSFCCPVYDRPPRPLEARALAPVRTSKLMHSGAPSVPVLLNWRR